MALRETWIPVRMICPPIARSSDALCLGTFRLALECFHFTCNYELNRTILQASPTRPEETQTDFTIYGCITFDGAGKRAGMGHTVSDIGAKLST